MRGGSFDAPEIPYSGIKRVEEQQGWSGRRQLAEVELGYVEQREVEQEPSDWTRGHGQAKEISYGRRAVSDALLKVLKLEELSEVKRK